METHCESRVSIDKHCKTFKSKIYVKIHAVGRRRAPKVPFALKPVNNTKGACGAVGAAGASTAVWETSWGVWFFLGTSVVIALA